MVGDKAGRAGNVGFRYAAMNPEFAPLLDETVPPEVMSVPSMMSAAERRFLYGLARSYTRGRGLIVDAGIFLGASTCCFGAGLKANPAFVPPADGARKPIVSMERGIITEHMMSFLERKKLPARDLDDSFADMLEGYIAAWRPLVDLRIGDFLATGRVEDQIELLFLDLLKAADLTEFAVRNYFARLIPGVSIVIQQDYFFHKLPFIKVAQEYFGDHFEYLGEIAASAVYRCIKPIGDGQAAAFALNAIPMERQLDLCRLAETRTHDPAKRFLMALSTADLLIRQSQLELAEDRIAAMRVEHADFLDLSWGQGRVYPFRATVAALEKAKMTPRRMRRA